MLHQKHISPILASLGWLPVQYRIDFKLLVFFYKSANGLAPLPVRALTHAQAFLVFKVFWSVSFDCLEDYVSSSAGEMETFLKVIWRRIFFVYTLNPNKMG